LRGWFVRIRLFKCGALLGEFGAVREILLAIEEHGAVNERRIYARIDAERSARSRVATSASLPTSIEPTRS
jgi:hypothetical protein